MSDIQVTTGVDNTGLEAGLAAAKEAMEAASEAMAASLEKVRSAMELVNTAMLALTAVLAGGAAFKEAVSASVDAAVGAQQLGRQLGITATQASILKVAMDQQHVPMESVAAAANKIATAIRKNPAEFDRLGVALRDSNGNLRNSFDIMTDVNSKLMELKEGTDRNVAGQQVYGRSWAEIAPSVRLTATAMEEAKEVATALHLIVGQEGIARSEAYRKAMVGVNESLEGVYKSIGDALVPVLTRLAESFKNAGNAADAARGTMTGLFAVFSRLSAIGDIIDEIMGSWALLANVVVGAGKAIERVMHMDFAGARVAWDKGMDNLAADTLSRLGKIKQLWTDSTASIEKAAADMAKAETPTTEKDGGAADSEDAKRANIMAKLEADLEERKAKMQAEWAAEGSMREFGKQDEIDYWNSVIGTTRAGSEERQAIEKKIAVDTQAIQKQTTLTALAELKNQADEQKDNLQLKLSLEYEYAAKVAQAYGTDSTQYAAAQKAIVESKREAVEQQKQADATRTKATRDNLLSEVALEQQADKQKLDHYQITTTQMEQLEVSHENKIYQIKAAALQQQMDLAALDPGSNVAKKAELDAQMEDLERQHQQNLVKIKQNADNEEISLQKNLASNFQSSMGSAFAAVVTQQQTFAQAFRGMMSSLLSTVASTVGQMLAKMVMQHLILMAQNKQEAASNAAVAATGGAKSAAAIPYVGWALAIGAAASIFAAASSYSAQDGFDVPSGLNPMTQLHSREMVLPQQQADVIRNMAQGGDGEGEGGAGGGDIHVHLPGTRQGNMFMMHNDDLVAAIKHAHRAGKLSSKA